MRPQPIYTVGYQGRSVDEFIAVLKESGITRVIDVRALPLSRRRGFSKTPLARALGAHRIDYVHVRAAGNPYRDQRNDVAKCLRLYGGHLDRNPSVVQLVEDAVDGQRAALLCMEHDARCCHRSLIAERLKERRPTLPVRDL
jgi:uncharacterized protein (DUF488 family)